MRPRSVRDRFVGSLVGLALGDALGGKFEAQTPEGIRRRFATTRQLIDWPTEELWYTDDTQMAIGVCETLVEHGEICEPALCRAFVANYVPSRGYGQGTRAVIEAMEDERDYQQVAEQRFPGGSLGNGAAMRVASVGLFFRDDHGAVLEQARLSALPTHRHSLGIEGAQLLALAVSVASTMDTFNRLEFFRILNASCRSEDFRARLQHAEQISIPDDLAELGNGIEALESVVTAITAFALTPDSYEESIANVIFLGGDTDTLAAMAGAVSGAYLGHTALPSRLIGLLEKSPKGGEYIERLASRLFDLYDRQHPSSSS